MNWTVTTFDPWAGLAGGVFIGTAVVLLLFSIGKIAGISGIVAGIFNQKSIELHWRLAFLAGLILSPILYRAFIGEFAVIVQTETLWMVIAGLLVGFGTRLGSGCTSGHGVAGLARLSPRSLVATLIFMVTAVATVSVIRYL
ncbi:YeeE/YedE family protein [Alteromonas sp. MYP5]|uniref:YeeE/YedE family protein n=2 Tax=Alteromonas ponticola TaxID=2720613 RepID=A0ABX1R3I0_9ALTE|nr:YeeE/YedE family protein [Alteromonas ponticola]